MLEPTLLLYLLIGAAAGTLAGLLGVGGGIIIVPALAFVFAGFGFSPAVLMHLAVGSSLATIVATSLTSVHAHHRRGAVLWPVFARLTPGIVVGAGAGSVIAHWLPGGSLRTVFGVFELLVAARMAFGGQPAPHRALPGLPGMASAGALIGGVSAVVGIGGGTLTVPFLAWCNVPLRNAVATSAACGLPIALVGALGFVINGWQHAALPAWSSGYVYWPAVLGIIIASMAFAPLGARLTHTVPVDKLKKGFAVFLAIVGIKLLVG